METNSKSSSRTSSPKDIASLSFWELFERSEQKEKKLRRKQEKPDIKGRNENMIDASKPKLDDSEEAEATTQITNSIPSFAQKLSDFTTQHLPYCISSKLTKIVSPIVNNENLFSHVFMPDSVEKQESCHTKGIEQTRSDQATTNLITKLKTKEGSKKYQKYLHKHPTKAVKIFDIIKKDIKEFGINEPARSFFLQLYSLLPLPQKQETWNIFANKISFESADSSSSIVMSVLDRKEDNNDDEMIVTAFKENFSILAYCKNGINILLKMLMSFQIETLKPLIEYIKFHLLQLISDSESAVLVKKVVSLMKDYSESEKDEVINLLIENPKKSITEKQSTNILILIMTEWGIHKIEKFINILELDIIRYVDNEHSNKLIKCIIERNEKVSP